MSEEPPAAEPIGPIEMRYRGPQGEQGPRGEKGARGGLTSTVARSVIFLFLLAVLLSAVSLFWINHIYNTDASRLEKIQEEQQAAGAALERKLCQDLGTMSRIQPPGGNPVSNPSRAYEQATHRAWIELYQDLGCKS